MGVPGAGGKAGGLVFTVVLVRASTERAALNFLAEEASGPGVEEREDSVELEVERVRLLNIDVGRRRRFEPCNCEFEDVLAMFVGSRSLAQLEIR